MYMYALTEADFTHTTTPLQSNGYDFLITTHKYDTTDLRVSVISQ